MPLSDEADARIMRYAEAASVHGKASANGDSKRANAAHDVIAGIYRGLRAEGTQQRLLPLLSHADPAVVTWAGAHALEFAPAEGERVLEQIARDGPGIFGFDAQSGMWTPTTRSMRLLLQRRKEQPHSRRGMRS